MDGQLTPRDEASPDPEAFEHKADERAAEMLHGGEGHEETANDSGAARTAARRILQESEGRVLDPATVDPHDDSVIRRSSAETA